MLQLYPVKVFLMLFAPSLAAYLAFKIPIGQSRPKWWQAITILSIFITIIFGLFPPIAGTITDVIMIGRMSPNKQVPVLISVPDNQKPVPDRGMVQLAAIDSRHQLHTVQIHTTEQIGNRLQGIGGTGSNYLVKARLGSNDRTLEVDELLDVDPIITLPYVMALEERARLIFFHVPMAWIGCISYLISMIYGIKYLRSRNLWNDTVTEAFASVGTVFTILATVTGAVWAKFDWGTYWNWDPRQVSIAMILFIYAAYFVLRSSIQDDQARARISSVYSIVAAVASPFLFFVLPRLQQGLHPGSAKDVNIGPLISPSSDAINPTKQIVYLVALFGFSMVFYWLVNLRIRINSLNRHIQETETT